MSETRLRGSDLEVAKSPSALAKNNNDNCYVCAGLAAVSSAIATVTITFSAT